MFLMEKEILEQPAVLERCRKENEAVISRIAGAFEERNCRFAVVAARGTSDHAATYFKYLFEIYAGIPVSLAAPSIVTAYGAQVNLADSMVIGVSQSGMAEDVLAVLRLAKKQGALCVSVTNNPASPLAKEADFHLDCAAGEEKSVAATKTFTAELMALSLLTAAVSKNAGLEERLRLVPGLIEKVLIDAKGVDALVTRYRFANECFMLGRGLLYPVALESALKVQETCYIRAKSYSAADFLHGPFAMTSGEIPVFCYAADRHTDKDLSEMIEKAADAGAEVVAVTNKPEIAERAALSFLLPPEAEGPSGVFAAAVFAQLFACRLSGLRGNNPDKPRGLKKVTITK